MTLIPPLEIQCEIMPSRGRNSQLKSLSEQFHSSDSSELSLDDLKKLTVDQRGQASAGRWNPEDSDYSLDRLLPCRTGESDTGKGPSLLGLDYSLDIKLKAKKPDSRACVEDRLQRSSSSLSGSARLVSAPVRKASKAEGNKECRRNVQFYPRVRIKRVPCRSDIKTERIWYSREEFKAIRKECFDTIKRMNSDESLDAGHCSRGLEYKTDGNYKQRQGAKKDIRTVVFEEQEFQREQGMDDPQWIAKLSQEQSRNCVQAAIDAALRDEEDAKDFLKDVLDLIS